MSEFCTCDRFALAESLDCPIHGNPEMMEMFEHNHDAFAKKLKGKKKKKADDETGQGT